MKYIVIAFLFTLILFVGCIQSTGRAVTPTEDELEDFDNPFDSTRTSTEINQEVKETPSVDEQEINCNENELECNGICVIKNRICSTDIDCDDKISHTKDTCWGIDTCHNECSHEEITECIDGDEICPDNCNALLDSDCPSYEFDEKNPVGDDIFITFSKPRERKCYSKFFTQRYDYGNYLVVDIKIENDGKTESDYFFTSDFTLLDTLGNQFESDFWVMGESCDDNELLESGKLYPKVKREGEIWFELGEKRAKGKYQIIFDPSSFKEGDEFVWGFIKN